MNKKKPGAKTAAASPAAEKKNREEVVRSAQDRADDPLFVPHIEALGISAEAIAESSDEYSAILESICGVLDDSQPVEQYDGTLGVAAAFVAAHQGAACQVQWNANLGSVYTNPGNVSGVRWGSGTMISDNLFLTCGHLFDQTGGGWNRPRTNGTTNIISPQEIARNMHLNFNFQVDPAGNLRPEQSFPILELLEYRLGGLDMAVCRIGGNPGAVFGRATLSPTDAAPPNMLCIIGHPAGQPKRIEAGPTTSIVGNLINYNDIDTLGGNSGSGILRASDGRLVGIHTNGGCTAASPAGGGSNFGQRIAAVIAASPTLQALLRPKIKVVDDPVTLKFRDDGGPKRKVLDDPITLKFRDDPPKLKFRDDIKIPVFDKRPGSEGKAPAFDNPLFDPGRIGRPGGGEAQPARPFILSTPHHSDAWQTGQSESGLEEFEAALVQYEQAMAAAEAELRQLDHEYRELLAQYESLGQGRQGG